MKEVLAEPGVLGLADTLVNTEERYRDVATSLLGRIVVVDNVDNAVRIARKYKYSLRMVTLEGELFNPGGSISGGAYKNNSNLLGKTPGDGGAGNKSQGNSEIHRYPAGFHADGR